MKKTNQQLDIIIITLNTNNQSHKNQNDEYDDHDEEALSSEGVGKREEG